MVSYADISLPSLAASMVEATQSVQKLPQEDTIILDQSKTDESDN